MSIVFEPQNHVYKSLDPADKTAWMSVTTLLGALKQPFDGKSISKKSATNKKSKWYGMTPDQIQLIWKKEADRACNLGNWYHDQRERDILGCETIVRYNEQLPVIRPLEDESGKKVASSQKLIPGIYPEHMLYMRSAGICGQSDLVEVANGEVHITDYKGLALDTPIPTPSGFKLMNQIQEGDVIFDGNGKQTTVVNVSEIHHNPCYKLIFDTNDELVADHEHKWVITERKTKGRSRTVSYVNIEMTTEELYHEHLAGSILRICCIEDLEQPDQKLPIDPYVLGVWLGDGSKSCGMVTNMTDAVWDEVKRRGFTLGDDVSNGGSGQAASRTLLGLYPELKKLALLSNKHIPDVYLTGSRQQRLELLRGLMDTDGYYNKARKRCVMVTTKNWQASAVMTLASSLGWKPTLIKAKTRCTTCKDKTFVECYHVTFKPSGENPFLVRNTEIPKIPSVKSTYRYIKRIEKVETIPTKCLAVDSVDHTYLAGTSYIKTHNTNKEIKTESFKNWEGISQKMLAPVSHLDDCNLNHYNLQLSIYMYIILKHNPTLKPGRLVIHHIIFEEEEEKDEYGYPITKTDADGNFIIKEIVPYEMRYMKDEVMAIMKWYKDNRDKIAKQKK